MAYGRWAPYVPVAKRKATAAKSMATRAKKGENIEPVTLTGRTISATFWGKAWCHQMEAFCDFANRLPRGRTYVRNGSVCHLAIGEAEINAYVSGSSLYTVKIQIQKLPATQWNAIVKKCSGQIGSIIELMQGKLSRQVMDIVTDPRDGLLPRGHDIKIHCSCPDGAYLCKHAAAVLYGVGARLDTSPELLFKLRGVDHNALIEMTPAIAVKEGAHRRVTGDLGALFGIEIDAGTSLEKPLEKPLNTSRKTTAKKTASTPPVPEPVAKQRVKQQANQKTKQNPKQTPSVKPFKATRTSIVRLRKQFGMTQVQFAQLLNVSVATLRSWEESTLPLKLQTRSVEALERAAPLSKDDAWKTLRAR